MIQYYGGREKKLENATHEQKLQIKDLSYFWVQHFFRIISILKTPPVFFVLIAPTIFILADFSVHHFFISFRSRAELLLQDPVGVILEPVVELGRERIDWLLDQAVDVLVQLLLRHADVEPALHALHRGRVGSEAGKLRAWKKIRKTWTLASNGLRGNYV